MYATSGAFLDAPVEAGVSFIFANVDTRATGRTIPDVINCPNEMVGMSAACGYWQASGVA